MESYWVAREDLRLDRLDADFHRREYVEVDRALREATGCSQPLRDISTRIFKGAFYVLQEEYAPLGVPFLRTLEIKPGFVDLADCVFIPPDVHLRERKTAVGPGNLVVAKTGGSIGYSTVIPNVVPDANICQDLVGVRLRDGVDPYYVDAVIKSPLGQLQALRWRQGNAHPHLGLEGIRLWIIPRRPPLERAIGNKLRKAEQLRELAAAARGRADREIDNLMRFGIADKPLLKYGWRPKGTVDQERLDAWFNRPEYVWRAEILASQPGLRSLRSLCRYITKAANVGQWSSSFFDYFEIGGIDATTGEALSNPVSLSEAPSRAKYLVQAGDLLVSTVRPNLKKVGQIDPHRVEPGVATSGFSVWRPPSPEIGAYLRACLVHEVAVEQMMRWNSGGTYPAIDADVPGRILVPFDEEHARKVGQDLLQALAAIREAGTLVKSAKAAVEALIDGTLDETALLAESDAIEQWLTENLSSAKEA